MPPILLAVLVILGISLTVATSLWVYLLWMSIQDRREEAEILQEQRTIADLWAQQEYEQ